MSPANEIITLAARFGKPHCCTFEAPFQVGRECHAWERRTSVAAALLGIDSVSFRALLYVVT